MVLMIKANWNKFRESLSVKDASFPVEPCFLCNDLPNRVFIDAEYDELFRPHFTLHYLCYECFRELEKK
jgi:hypothetical protein